MSHHVELLWFADCPNHPEARRLVADTIKRLAPTATFAEIDASDPEGPSTAIRAGARAGRAPLIHGIVDSPIGHLESGI